MSNLLTRILLLASLSAAFAPAAIQAYADTPGNTLKPLLIIRFNQPGVQYKQPLKHVVEKVQELKQDATFEVVSVVPTFDDSDKNKTSKQIAEYNAKKVAEAVESFDIPSNHVRIRYQESDSISMNEVHITAY